MSKYLIVFITIFMASMQSEAISLRYKFKVFSSGPSIYACNAGVLTQGTNRNVCYFENTKEICDPDTCSTAEENCQSSCICSGSNGGGYLMNYAKADYKDWKDHHELNSVTGAGSESIRANTANQWKQMFTDEEAWEKVLTNLSFEFGSELYTAKYFVDVCYRGPQIEYYEDDIKTNFSIFVQTAGVNFLAERQNPGENTREGLVIPENFIQYIQRAGVNVQAFVTCDKQGVGDYIYARNQEGYYNTTDNEADFTFGGMLPNNAAEGSGSYIASPVNDVPADGVVLVDQWLVNNSAKTPRFCKVRYVYTETDFNTPLPNFRSWTRHGAEICTYTRIEEDGVNESQRAWYSY